MGRPNGSKNTVKRGKNLTNRQENVTIRLRAAEKKRIEQQAKKHSMSTSEYIRKKLSDKTNSEEKEINVAVIVIEVQNILNYMVEKGLMRDNEVLKERMDKIWKNM